MKKIFLAFPGYNVGLKKAVTKVQDVEFLNLEKISCEEFIKLIKQKVKPINRNVKKNYFHNVEPDKFDEIYKEASWGILLPNYFENYSGIGESHFTINLFSNYAMPLVFSVNGMGLIVFKHKLRVQDKTMFHNQDKLFTNRNFVKFYNEMCRELGKNFWNAMKVPKWSQEDWRYCIASQLLEKLYLFEKSKAPMTWMEECAATTALYETLFSRGTNDAGRYKVVQRAEVLLGKVYGKSFFKVKEGLGHVYNHRNDFLHGSLFSRLQKETAKALKASSDKSFASLPNVDFRFLEEQRFLAKKIFITFIYLKKKFQTRLKKSQSSVPELIHQSILNIKLRQLIQKYTHEILGLLRW